MHALRWTVAACALAGSALAAAPLDPVQTLAGRYSSHFRNGTVVGDHYWSDDIVEIVPVDARHAYVRFELQFYNGHSCSLFGVAETTQSALTYREPSTGGHCTLRIERRGDKLFWDDGDGSCQSYCGARGSFIQGSLPWSSKRPIRYMDRLKQSSEYNAALSEWRKK